MKGKSKVIVAGGGFAGVEASIYLKKSGFDVTLISERDFMYIYPVSIWIPTGTISPEKAMLPLKELAAVHSFELIIDEIIGFNPEGNLVVCKNGTHGYDYLVIAIGAGKANPEGAENTLSICGKPEESIKIKETVEMLTAKGRGVISVGIGGNPKDSSAMRGGPAFEMLFNFDAMLRKKNLRNNFELNIFAPMETPGIRLGEKAYGLLNNMYENLGIKKHFGKKIKKFETGAVVFEDDSKLKSDLIVFVPAGSAHKVFSSSPLPLTDAGFIKTDDTLKVEGYENIYAIGDSANLEGPPFRGKQGHVAELMARIAAGNIAKKESGDSDYDGYKEHVHILCVMDNGRGAVYVRRDNRGERVIPLPVVGRWLKRIWGWYYKNSKLNKIPRIPGF